MKIGLGIAIGGIGAQWVIVGTIIRKAPFVGTPSTPVITSGVLYGTPGVYLVKNLTQSPTGAGTEYDLTPPVALTSFGDPGDSIEVYRMVFSSEGPTVALPSMTQIGITSVGTLVRSGATVTLTPAVFDQAGVTVTRTKIINGGETTLSGLTFTANAGDTYFVREIATKSGFLPSNPAETAVGNRPTGLVYVGGKKIGFSGGTTAQTISLTDLTGGTDTSPLVGDLVIVGYDSGSNTDRVTTINTSGYTSVADLYSNDSYDANLIAGYKRMSSTPDTSVQVSGTGSSNDGGAVVVHVWRNVDPTTPMDVTPTTATGLNTGRPTPPAITPVTSGAVIVMIGGGGTQTPATYTSSLDNFLTQTRDSVYDAMIGIGSAAWTSGTYTPAQWGGGSNAAADSWAAVTMALRPAS